MYGSLREYIDLLEREGELVRIKACVNPVEEMAEIADRVVKHGGRALLFENTGTAFPVAMNLFGSDRRMALALGVASLDELPEAFNIIKGDMSVVGPRPLLVKYLPYYTEEQRKRHTVRPGLTGYAQAHGRNLVSWDEKFQMDVNYTKKITFAGDVKIIFETVISVLKHEGISSETSATMESFIDYCKNTGRQPRS